MLELNNISFDYPDKPVLQDASFRVEKGQLLHLRGANGSGKTTLLKVIAGLLHPEQGSIRYQDQFIAENIASYQQKICYIGHKPGISLLLTVAENCRYGLQKFPDTMPLNEVLKQFDLVGLENVPCGLLSAGQRRRVGLLKLVIARASLWLLDEPLVSLDQQAVELLLGCITNHLNNQGIIVMSSHQIVPLSSMNYKEYCL